MNGHGKERAESIRLEDLAKVYHAGDSEIRALKEINLRIDRGEFVSLMGPSGSGKSTLLHILGCLDVPTSGKYFLDGEDVSELQVEQRSDLRNKKLGFVFQGFNLLQKMSAIENVELPLVYAHTKSAKRRQAAMDALNLVGLSDRALHVPSQLSGGQQQRVAIARALVNQPEIILADEPTGNLDSQTGQEIMDVLRDLNQARSITIILVTHDPEVAGFSDRCVLVRDGCIVGDGPVRAAQGDPRGVPNHSRTENLR